MRYSRRTILAGVTTTAVTGPIILPTKKAWAPPPPPPPKKGVYAIQTNGTTYAQNPGGFPILPTVLMPYTFFAYRFNSSLNAVFTHNMFYAGTSDSYYSFSIAHVQNDTQKTGGKYKNPRLVVSTQQFSPSHGSVWQSNSNIIPYDSQWHLLLCGIDGTTGSIQVRLDGNPIIMDTGLAGPASIDWRTGHNNLPVNFFNAGLPTSFGGLTSGNWYKGAIAEFGVWAPQSYIDPTEPNVVAMFTDSNSVPMHGASTGPQINGEYPIFWFSGPTSLWSKNLTASAYRFPSQQNPSTPTGEFTVVGNPWQVPNSDPWGNVGV